jgi:ureidoglycolate dehydrogenase (NAD+)
MSDDIRVGFDELKSFTSDLFHAGGMPREHSDIVAEVLCWAEFRGVDSHGLERVPRYLELVASGQMNAKAAVAIRDVAGAAFVVDSDKVSGLVAMTKALDEATKRAGEFGVSLGLVSNTTHTGAIGYYADRAARAGYAAIVMAAGMPLMAWPGTRAASVSTSPLAIGVPGGPSGAMVFDMSTAIASSGRLKSAMREGRPLPDGYALDKDGNPTSDAGKAVISMPVGGAKGAGLSLMIEILASVLGAQPITADLAPIGAKRRHTANGLVIVIDIAKFRDVSGFSGDVDSLVEVVKNMPRFADAEPVRMPGERGAGELAARMATGTQLPARLCASLAASAQRLGVRAPASFPVP